MIDEGENLKINWGVWWKDKLRRLKLIENIGYLDMLMGNLFFKIKKV